MLSFKLRGFVSFSMGPGLRRDDVIWAQVL
jgi:hypothetical protein